jgi:Mg-chelatase subunit ChlD
MMQLVRRINRRRNCRRHSRKGAILILVAVLSMACLLVGAYSVNVARTQLLLSETQMAADVGARSGVHSIYMEEPNHISEKMASVYSQEARVANQVNDSNEISVELGSTEISSGKVKFIKDAKPSNAMRVTVTKKIKPAMPVAGLFNQSMKIERTAVAAILERDIVLVLDRSGSMTWAVDENTWMNDRSKHSYNQMSTSRYSYLRNASYQWWWYWPHPEKSRWQAAINATYGLCDELDETSQKENLSIVSYSTDYQPVFYDHSLRRRRFNVVEAEVEAKPTTDYRAAAKQVEKRYYSDQPVAGGTNIAAGIDLATEVLMSTARPYAFKTIILMTDGQATAGRDPILSAREARANDIEVHTVTFGASAARSHMGQTAAAGGGHHFHAPDAGALEAIFREIASMPARALVE